MIEKAADCPAWWDIQGDASVSWCDAIVVTNIRGGHALVLIVVMCEEINWIKRTVTAFSNTNK